MSGKKKIYFKKRPKVKNTPKMQEKSNIVSEKIQQYIAKVRTQEEIELEYMVKEEFGKIS